jgi:hypothetical protein
MKDRAKSKIDAGICLIRARDNEYTSETLLQVSASGMPGPNAAFNQEIQEKE